MSPAKKPPTPEREQTDESLRMERHKADDALADRTPGHADVSAVVIKARARADAVLAESRAKVDRRAAPDDLGATSTSALEAERRRADEALRGERAAADAIVRRERAHDAALLAAEREETDKDLSLERARSDVAVATRDEFLGVVSHDLRNMLGAIVGFATLIADAELGRTEHKADDVLMYTGRIQRSGARMSSLIGDLVDVASIEAGVLAVTRAEGDPRDVVKEAVEMFQTQASARGISLGAELAAVGTLADFDAARILQVLANLIANAIKFTPSGGRVVVHTLRAEGEVRIAVKDTGIGIPADRLDAVFERFRQLKSGDTRGVGLGLYISKSIIQGHGGRIWAESSQGDGSTFWFALPLHVAA